MHAIAVLAVWYGIGLGTAWVMARAGHDPFPWVLVGWVTGAWAAPAAFVFVRVQRRRADRRRHDADTTIDLRGGGRSAGDAGAGPPPTRVRAA